MRIVSGTDLLSAPERELPQVLREPIRVPVHGVTLVHGPPNCGKSWVALDAALQVACSGRSVVAVLGEANAASLRGRIKGLLRGDSNREPALSGIHFVLDPPEFENAAALDPIFELCELVDPYLFVVDPLASVFVGDENSSESMGGFCRLLRRFAANELGALVVHHDRKPVHGAPRDARGSSALRAAADQVFSLDERAGVTVVRNTKSRDFPRLPDTSFRLESGPSGPSIAYGVSGAAHTQLSPTALTILDALARGPLTQSDLRKVLHRSGSALSGALESLIESGRVVAEPSGYRRGAGRPTRLLRLVD